MRRSTWARWGGFACAAWVALAPLRARAIPAFARKYGMSCTACHEAWPKLNDQGIAFRDNGYQWGTGKDSPIRVDPAYWPLSFRSTVGYQWTSLGNQQTNQGPTTIQSGRLGYTSGELLMAGTLAHDVSFLAVLDPLPSNAGFSPAYPTPTPNSLLESLWVRLDDLLETSWINFKVGLGALDLPFDAQRSLTVFTPYSVYDYHPGGGANFMPFAMAASQFQATLEGHDSGSRTRYAVGLIQTQNDPGGALALSSPGFYGHLQHSFYPWPDAVPEIRAGLFGLAGSYPTMALYSGGAPGTPNAGPLVNPNGSFASIAPGTAFDLREYYREGADLSIYLGSLALPLNLEIAYVYGQEDPAFIANGEREALFQGGFVEADWTPRLDLTFVARWDAIRNLQQADPTQPQNLLDTDQLTGAVRYTLSFIPRAAVTLHGEVSYQHVVGAGFGGTDLDAYLCFGGVDFAF